MTLSLLICIAGLAVWCIFTKWQKVADAWLARVGELSFFAGLLAYLIAVGSKAMF